MTVVVDDTSPLNYLVLIEAIDLLPRLYRRVLIPQEVFQKLREPGAPPPVSAWIDEPPDWLEVRLAPWVVDPALDALDPGERAAILLAQQESDVLLLMDDASGRLVAIATGSAKHGDSRRAARGSCRQ